MNKSLGRDVMSMICFSRHLKALVFLYAFEEPVDCHLFSSFCDDSSLHIFLFIQVCTFHDLGKVSPTFPAALFSVDARFARKIERPQTGRK